jgi:hypothetical protein
MKGLSVDGVELAGLSGTLQIASVYLTVQWALCIIALF